MKEIAVEKNLEALRVRDRAGHARDVYARNVGIASRMN